MKFADVRKYVTGLLSASFVNKNILANLAEDENANLTYKGAAIEGGGGSAETPKNIVLYAEDSEVIDLPTAAPITIDEELNETSTNPVQNKVITSKLNEVFQSVSDGKSLIASAITDKGIATDATATFDTMAGNIRAIESGGSRDVNIDNFQMLRIGVINPVNGEPMDSTQTRAYTHDYTYIKAGQSIKICASTTCDNITDSFYAFYYDADKVYNQAVSEKYYNGDWINIIDGVGLFTPDDEGFFRFVFRNQNNSSYSSLQDNLKIYIEPTGGSGRTYLYNEGWINEDLIGGFVNFQPSNLSGYTFIAPTIAEDCIDLVLTTSSGGGLTGIKTQKSFNLQDYNTLYIEYDGVENNTSNNQYSSFQAVVDGTNDVRTDIANISQWSGMRIQGKFTAGIHISKIDDDPLHVGLVMSIPAQNTNGEIKIYKIWLE